jgi:primosomal protein N'
MRRVACFKTMPFITVVPSLRTIPGVESFDYAVPAGSDLVCGDLILVPFRKKPTPALVIARSDSSPYAEKAIELTDPTRFISLGPTTVALLSRLAARTFSSQPSILHSWLRKIPKRAKEPKYALPPSGQIPLAFNSRKHFSSPDLRHGSKGIIRIAKQASGRTLILSPWKKSADSLAVLLSCPVLHSDLADGEAWRLLTGFISGSVPRLVTTKIGAWLTCFADRILVEEPENDDYKQDEMAPRFDARWIVDETYRLRRGLEVFDFSLTPRLANTPSDTAANIRAEPIFENLSRRGRTELEPLMATTVFRLEEAAARGRAIVIIHPPRGERSRYACSSCGWQALCPACGYSLTQYRHHGLCRKCGRKTPLPAACPNCQGTDFSRGALGQERLKDQLARLPFGSVTQVWNLTQAAESPFPPDSLVVLTNAAYLAGAVEDIRRRERLVIAWRRLAAQAQIAKAELIVQAQEEVLPILRETLSSEGVAKEQARELQERQVFGFPPADTLVKIIVDAPETQAKNLMSELENALPPGWSCSGPYPVPYRADSRGARSIILAKAPPNTDPARLEQIFGAFKGLAFIDLDPVAFFC